MSSYYTQLCDLIKKVGTDTVLTAPFPLISNLLRSANIEDICEVYELLSSEKFAKDTKISPRICASYAYAAGRHAYYTLDDIYRFDILNSLWYDDHTWINIDENARDKYDSICAEYGRTIYDKNYQVSALDVVRTCRKIRGIVKGAITTNQAKIILTHAERYRPLLRDLFDVTVSKNML